MESKVMEEDKSTEMKDKKKKPVSKRELNTFGRIIDHLQYQLNISNEDIGIYIACKVINEGRKETGDRLAKYRDRLAENLRASLFGLISLKQRIDRQCKGESFKEYIEKCKKQVIHDNSVPTRSVQFENLKVALYDIKEEHGYSDGLFKDITDTFRIVSDECRRIGSYDIYHEYGWVLNRLVEKYIQRS